MLKGRPGDSKCSELWPGDDAPLARRDSADLVVDRHFGLLRV